MHVEWLINFLAWSYFFFYGILNAILPNEIFENGKRFALFFLEHFLHKHFLLIRWNESESFLLWTIHIIRKHWAGWICSENGNFLLTISTHKSCFKKVPKYTYVINEWSLLKLQLLSYGKVTQLRYKSAKVLRTEYGSLGHTSSIY